MVKRLRLPVAILAFLCCLSGGIPARAQGDIGRELERQYGVVGRDTDERRQMNDELDRVVARMAPAVGYKPKSARILGGKDPRVDKEINALALPDGRIYVMAGLLTAAQRTSHPDASVAFVVGHELTHVVKHHSRKQMKGNILGALGGALLAQVLGAGASTVRTASDLGSGLIGGHYSRQHEYEADKGGLIGMARAGYPVDSAAEMMQVLLDRYGEDRSAMANWFGDHPNTKNRVLRLKEMAAEIKDGRIPLTPDAKDSSHDNARSGSKDAGKADDRAAHSKGDAGSGAGSPQGGDEAGGEGGSASGDSAGDGAGGDR